MNMLTFFVVFVLFALFRYIIPKLLLSRPFALSELVVFSTSYAIFHHVLMSKSVKKILS